MNSVFEHPCRIPDGNKKEKEMQAKGENFWGL
jgi:hypothetical protein